MVSQKPFSVRIFMQDGRVDGVQVIARSKWSGRALVIPRAALGEEIKRKELDAPALYLLVRDVLDGELPSLKIGSAEPVSEALEESMQHDFWTRAIIFAAKDNGLSMTQMKYFESQLLKLASESESVLLKNQDIDKPVVLAEEDLAATQLFLDHILSLCPVLGLDFFAS